MRLLTLDILAALLTVTQVAIGFALPTYTNTLLDSAESYTGIDKRANSQLTVQLDLVALET